MSKFHKNLLDRNSAIPLYYQIMEIISNQLEEGKLKEGELLQPEADIAEALGVSRATVRQAVLELVRQKKLFRVPGRGTFVVKTESKLTRGMPGLTSFTEDVIRSGKKPGAKLISFEAGLKASGDIAQALALRENEDTLVRIKRLMSVDEEPVGLHEVYLPERIWDRVGVEAGVLTDGSLYSILEQNGIAIAGATETIKVSRASKDTAHRLGIDVNEPVLFMNRIAYGTDGKPVEYAFNIYRPDRYSYKIEHQRVAQL